MLTAFCRSFDRIAVGLLRSNSLHTAYFTLPVFRCHVFIVLTAFCHCSFDRRAVGLFRPST